MRQPPKQPSFPERSPPSLAWAQRRTSTRARWIILAALGGLLVVGCVVVMVRVTSAPTATSEELTATGRIPVPVKPAATPPAAAQDSPGIGKPARDGGFVFVVRRLDCGRTRGVRPPRAGTVLSGRRASRERR